MIQLRKYDAVFAQTFLTDIFNKKSSDAIISSIEAARPAIDKYISDIFTLTAEIKKRKDYYI